MLEEINWRSDEDIDEEALNILLRKYYQMWLENGITRTFTSEELNQYPDMLCHLSMTKQNLI